MATICKHCHVRFTYPGNDPENGPASCHNPECPDRLNRCTCDQLPEFDMDGSRFSRRCNFCVGQFTIERFSEADVRSAAKQFGRLYRTMLLEFEQMADDGPYGPQERNEYEREHGVRTDEAAF